MFTKFCAVLLLNLHGVVVYGVPFGGADFIKRLLDKTGAKVLGHLSRTVEVLGLCHPHLAMLMIRRSHQHLPRLLPRL